MFAGCPDTRGFVDDWLIALKNVEEHLAAIEEFLKRVRSSGFLLKPGKAVLFQTSITFLGRNLSARGTSALREDLDAIRVWPVPGSESEILSFLGLGRWIADFMPAWQKVTRPLYRTARRVPFVWDCEDQRAFEEAKKCAMSAIELAFPVFGQPFEIETDASGKGVGAVLSQEGWIVRVAHRALKPAKIALPAMMVNDG